MTVPVPEILYLGDLLVRDFTKRLFVPVVSIIFRVSAVRRSTLR